MRQATRTRVGNRPLLEVVLFCAGCAGLLSPVSAGVNTWTQLGPEGGFLCGLAVSPSDPGTVYAAGYSFFRSSDSGASWESTGARSNASSCLLSVDVADPLRLYSLEASGLGSSRVMRSLDGGSTWTAVQSDFFGYPTSPIAIGAQDANLLFFTSSLVYRSRDRGDTWQHVSSPPGVAVLFIAIHPTTAGRVFAVTAEDGLFVSADYGDHWAPFGLGLPVGLRLLTLRFDPLNHNVLYLLTGDGVYRSRNGGETWSQCLAAGSGEAAGLLAIRQDSTLFVVRSGDDRSAVLRSQDGGDTWQDLGNPYPWVPTGYFHTLVTTPTALLGTGYGIARSTDNGASWQESNSGLIASDLLGFGLDRENPERLFGLHQMDGFHPAGLRRSLDRGATWQHLPVSTPAGELFVVDFLVDPNDPRHFLVAVLYPSPGGLSGLASSLDAGETWSALADPISCQLVTELVIDPLQSSRLFLLAMQASFCNPDCYTFTSVDSGETWQCIPPGELPDVLKHMVPSPYTKGVVLALGSSGIYRSTNSGEDWTRVAGAPTYDPGYAGDIEWASADTAYATSAGAGLYASHDGGLSWEPRSTPPEVPQIPWMVELAVDPFHPERVYALSKTGQNLPPREVVASGDGGRTWELLSEGLAGWILSDLRIDPVTPNRLYVSAYGGGILAYDIEEPESCVPSATALCVTGGRFKIESLWRDFSGHSGVGHAVPLVADTGAFWFFDPENLELFVKEIDGTGTNNAFWTFYGALSNVELTVLATDTATGAQHGYFNPSRQFASRGDIDSFPQGEGFASPARTARPSSSRTLTRTAPQRSSAACVPNATTLCLQGGRFAASVTWRDFVGRTGVGTALPITPDTGSFWFFDAGIHELAVKVIDGQGTNNAFWVFYGSLSNVEFELTVVDTETGEIWSNLNPMGTFASGGDIEAFPQLP